MRVNVESLGMWLDRLAIQDLVYRYSDSVTRADWDQTATVFAEDAIWESPLLDMRFESARAFIDFLRGNSSGQGLLIQTAHGSVIEFMGSGQAKATTTVHELFRGATADASVFGDAGAAINFKQYGVYFDEVAMFGDDWKFTHRLFVPIYLEHDRVSGDIVSPRPLLRPA